MSAKRELLPHYRFQKALTCRTQYLERAAGMGCRMPGAPRDVQIEVVGAALWAGEPGVGGTAFSTGLARRWWLLLE